MDFTEIMVMIIGLIGTVITGVVIPYVKSKLNAEQLGVLDYWLRVLIAAAETTIGGESMGEKKKAWVLDKLDELGVKYDREAVGNAIDGICREMTAGLIINNGAPK